MEKPMMRRTAKYKRQYQRRKAWQRAAALMAALTVFFTAYTVMLPEATFAEGIYCGLEEHQHTEECYTKVCTCEWAAMVVETLAPHEHTEACAVEHRELTCGLEETEGKPAVIHTHGDACYSASRELTCAQEETAGKPEVLHTHGEECYSASQEPTCGLEETVGKPAVTHTHGDGCYSVSRELTCGQQETEGKPAVIHAHGAACYAAAKELICGKEESAGHVHTAECAKLESVLVCEIAEEGHTHADDCYELVQKNICGKNEGDDAHTHADACYTETKTLTCAMEEGVVVEEAIPAHAHTETCYTETKALTCALKEGAVVEEAIPAHTHTEACYTQTKTLTCALEEGAVVEEAIPAHAHADACYTETKALICTLEEGAVEEEAIPVHTHTDECYTVTTTMACPDPTATPEPEHIHTEACYEQALTCELPEHTHELMCYSDPEADVESEEDWKRSVSGVKLTGDWAKDLIAVARTQLGYQESQANYQVNENGEPKGYTRYGAWRGLPYEDWSALFVAFCLNYAKVPKAAFPREEDCAQWVSRLKGRELYLSRDKAEPKPGDIVFFRAEGSGSANHMGIVTSVSGGSIHTIEGDSADSVAKGSYSMSSNRILGFGIMPENPELEKPAEEPATPTATAEPTDSETAETAKPAGEEPTAAPAATTEPTDSETAETAKPSDEESTAAPTATAEPTDSETAETAKPTGEAPTAAPTATTEPADSETAETAKPTGEAPTAAPTATTEPTGGEAAEATEPAGEQPAAAPTATMTHDEGQSADQESVTTPTDETGAVPSGKPAQKPLIGSITTQTDMEQSPSTEDNALPNDMENSELNADPDASTPEHIHTEECVTRMQLLTCENEDPEHQHTEDCYEEIEYLSCGYGDEALEELPNFLADGASGQYDFSQNVTKVSIQHRAPGETSWKPVDLTTGAMQAHDELLFTLDYEIPGGKLNANKKTLIYKTPIPVTVEDSGTAYSNGQPVGTYQVSTDGTITIEVNDTFVQSNSNGSPISGYISFQGSADELETDSKGEGTLDFTKPIPIHITNKENNTADLQVTKTASNVDKAAGTVTYTVTVTSAGGTGKPVTLNDVMTGISLDGPVTIRDKNGNTRSSAITSKDDGFSVELPKMEAGDSYTLTYSAKLSDAAALNGKVNANNKVDVRSEDHVGGTLVDADDVDTEFERYVLAKTGVLSADKKTITWTVTVNTSKINIGGWVLSDQLGNSAFNGEVTISPSPDGGAQPLKRTLPYTFPPNSSDTYTITYTTQVPTASLGNNSVSNTATLTPPGGTGISAGSNVNTGDNNPLTKKAAGVILSGQEGGSQLAEYKWTVNIVGPVALGDYTLDGHHYTNIWYYGDELWNEKFHWMTGKQLKDMERNLSSKGYTGFEIYAYSWHENGPKFQDPTPLASVNDTAKYGQFRILFHQPLGNGQTISFDYSSTGNVGDGTVDKELTNQGTINNQAYQNSPQKYKPVVTKKDKEGDTHKDTHHDIGNAHLPKTGKGILGWNVDVTLPDPANGADLVITENLPEGTKLLYIGGDWNLSIELTGEGGGGGNFGFVSADPAQKQRQVTIQGYTVTAVKESENRYIITIPQDAATALAGRTFRIQVRVQIDSDFNWDTVSKEFKNTVTVTSNKQKLGEASQTQIIRNPVVSKAAGTFKDGNLPYSLTINPERKDLVPGSDKLTLTDVFAYTQTAEPIVATLVRSSVKVIQINEDGTQTDITAQCPYTLEDSETGGKVRKTIKMTVPDGESLRIEYQYNLASNSNNEQAVEFSNSASLAGGITQVDEEENKISVTIKKSMAGMVLKGIIIEKVDWDNNGIALGGAEFTLYEWQKTTGYTPVDGVYQTDEEGKLSLPNLKENVAYKLVESKAPQGYELDPAPYFFYIASGSGEVDKPDDFNGQAFNPGRTVIITNKKSEGYRLPSTGGSGTRPYIIGGQVTICAGLVLLCGNRKRRKK